MLDADTRLLCAAGPGDFERCRQQLDHLRLPYQAGRRKLDYQPGPYRAILADAHTFIDCFNAVIQAWPPDLVVAQAAGWRDVVRRSRASGVRVVHWMHGWLGLVGDEDLPAADLLLANSEYTSQQVLQRFGLQSRVFHPPVEPNRVRADRSVCWRHAGP